MKHLFAPIALLAMSLCAAAQDFSNLKTIPLTNEAQCKKAETKVLECANYLLSKPCVEDVNSIQASHFIYQWMMKTPDFTFNMQDTIYKSCLPDSMLCARYLACQAKVAVTATTLSDYVGFVLVYSKIFVAYCENPANKVKITPAVQRFITMEKNGKLEALFEKIDIEGMKEQLAGVTIDSLKIQSLYALSQAFASTNLDSSVFYSQQAVLLSRKSKSKLKPGAEIDALIFLANTLWYAGNYPDAEATFLEALQKAEPMHDTMMLAAVYNGIAMVNRNEGNFRQSLDYYTITEKLTRHFHDNGVLAEALCDKGKSYEQLNILDSALTYEQEAMAMEFRMLHYNSEGIISEMGNINSKMGNKKLAEDYFHQSFDRSIKGHDMRLLGRTYSEFAEHFLRNNSNDSAIYYATRGLLIDEQYHFLVQQIAASTILTKLYTQQNKIDSAFKYQSLMIATKDSVFSNEKITRLSTLEFNEQIRRQDKATSDLKLKKERDQNIQYALIAVGLIIAIILFLLLSRSVITNTRIIEFLGVMALLIVFEFLNLLLHPFLEKYTHSTPLLMLLALVCISAILIPGHHRLEKWATQKLVEKNKQVRLAAAKKTIEKLEGGK